ncbi:MAG: hypothetical protein H6626_03120 [Pseudobdellovibrionaceae bacterium]|nr:hypothetical protein [Bdellovibrionales bacterium]USN48094.1 MAG: hypothetical protein H6626_03120 [Pseudobdellovibrionaceae bacterium]
MAAKLKYYHKAKLHNRYIIEIVLYEVPKTKKYPLGVRYSLICIEPKSGHKVLMDNHHPKGPHLHIDDREIDYDFVTDEKLFDDFEQLVLEHMGVKL